MASILHLSTLFTSLSFYCFRFLLKGSSQDQLVRGSITRAVESNAKSNTPISKSPVTSEGLADSVGTSPSSSVPVVQHSATLNTPMEVDEAGKPTEGSSHEAADVGKVDSTSSKERKSPEETASTSKTMTSSLSDASEPVAPSEESQSNSTSVKTGVVGKQGSSGELDFLPSLLPSDLTLDNLLKDIAGDSPASGSDELVPFDVSEIIQSIENMPNEPTSSSETADLPTDTVTAASERVTSDKTGRDSELSDDVDKEPSHRSKRQSQRRLPTSSLSTPVKSSAEAVPQNTSGTFKILKEKAISGIHDPEPTTLLCSYHGVFIDRFIFRLNFPGMRLPQEPDDQLQEIKLTS